ncbi:MAG: TonB-dependent receptor [Bacteroides sp.]|nr:TonB-dependent receptor [Bacteroides sp.]
MNKFSLWGMLPPRKTQTRHVFRMMQITWFLAFFSILSVYAENSHSQNTQATLSRSDCPLEEVLSEIEQQTNYLFVVNSHVDLRQKVSVYAKEKPVSEVLSGMFAKTHVKYNIEGSYILLTTAPQVEEKSSATQARKPLTGKVIDENGEELIGANVTLKGTANGTITDINGNFSLTGDFDEKSVLVVTYIGMKAQEVRVGQQSHVVITLRTDYKTLDEVVVVGYGTQRKENLTGSVSTVNVKDQLTGRSIPDIARGLQGSAPGLTIRTNTGAIGTDASIRVRGIIGSVNGSSSPLVLVDNAEVSSLQIINPDDVESISILKDAASTSIYGTRAAFGVVLITTKKAREEEKFTINYSNNFSWRRPTVTPTISSAVKGAEMSWEAGLRSNPNLQEQRSDNFLYWNLESIERMREWERVYGHMKLSDEMVPGRDFEVIDNKLYFYRSFDAPDKYINKNAFQQTHNLSVNGTVSQTSYNLSLGYLEEEGVIKVNTDKFQRYNVTFGTSTQVSDRVNVRSKLIFSKTILETPYEYSTSDNYNSWYYLYRWPRIMPYGTYEGIPFRNAVTETEQANRNNRTNNYTRISLGTTIHIIKGLSVDMDYVYTRTDRLTRTNGGEVSGWNFWNGGLTHEVWTPASKNMVRNATDQSDFHVGNIVGRYNKEWSKHKLNALAGMNIEYYTNTGLTGERRDLVDPSKPEFSLATGDQFASGYHGHWACLGYFGRINYSYHGRYLLELNGRMDGSSRFPQNNLWGFFPSASAGWIVSEEAFMQPVKPWLSHLKVRASWGTIGNQDVESSSEKYVFLPILSSTSSEWVRGETAERTFGLPRAISSGFTWEKVTTTNIGVDLRFFNDRLGVTFDRFTRVTSNMITSGEALPSTFGHTAPKVNFGELTTKGWEIAVDFRHRFTNGWSINATASLYDARIKYTKYRSGSRLVTDIYEGKTYGEIWGYVTDRFFTEDDFDIAPDGTYVLKSHLADQSYISSGSGQSWFRFGPGDVKFKDLDGDGKIDKGDNTVDNPGDMKVIGNSTPRYEYGLRLGMDYKGVDLGVFLQGVGKRQLWSSGSIFIPGFAHTAAWYTHQEDYWTPENPNAFYPRLTPTGQSSNTMNFVTQTKYLLNMAYCRVKNVTIGYTLPQKIVRKAHIKNLRVYLNLENLFEFHHLGNIPIDPETNISTGDGGYIGRSYPYTRTTSLGLQVSF